MNMNKAKPKRNHLSGGIVDIIICDDAFVSKVFVINFARLAEAQITEVTKRRFKKCLKDV